MMTGRMGQVLSFLERNCGGVTAREISNELKVSVSAIYQILKDLEESGTVEYFLGVNYRNRLTKTFKLIKNLEEREKRR